MDFDKWWEEYKDQKLPNPVKDAFKNAFEAGQRYEREACAKVAEDFNFNDRPEIEPPRNLPRYVAQAIRARSNA